MSAIRAVNTVPGPRFITTYGSKQGVLVLGKQLPLALGVGVGAGGNHVFGRLTIAAAKMILGPAPDSLATAASAQLGRLRSAGSMSETHRLPLGTRVRTSVGGA